MFAGHSDALVLLLAGCAVLVGAHGYWHARRYWEGLPPLLDAFVSMAGFIGIIGAFVWAGRIGATYGPCDRCRHCADHFSCNPDMDRQGASSLSVGTIEENGNSK
jgi:hypothetical protein